MTIKEHDRLEDFETFDFEHDGKRRTVFRQGAGPGVLVMHEMPGITPEVAGFGRRLAAEGFAVYLPRLFGDPGRPFSGGYLLGQLARCCISAEFATLAKHGSSPIADWLRALARRIHEERGGKGVGALGMCFTGGFALPLMMEPAVLAPVLSQPSLPFGVTAAHRCALGLSGAELENVKSRTRAGARVLGLRFTDDKMSPAERFATLRDELKDGFEAVEIDSSPGNAHGIPRSAHCVLTNDFVDSGSHPTRAAYDRVVAFFRERLREGGVP